MRVTDAKGMPIGFKLCAANHSEHKLAQPTMEQINIRQKRGRPKSRPKALCADRGYASNTFRSYLRARGIKPCIPDKRRPGHWRSKRGRPTTYDRERYKKRFIIERSFAWLGNYRRLLIRWEHIFSVYRAFFLLALIQLSLNRLLK
jgi:transposase